MFDSQKLGEILVQRGQVKENDVERALDQQREHGGRIGELLMEMKACRQQEVTAALGEQLGLPVLERINVDELDMELLRELSLSWTHENAILPLSRIGESGVRVAINDPLNVAVLDQLRFVLQREPDPVLVPRESLLEAINAAFDRKMRMMTIDDGLKNAETRTEEQDDIPEFEDLLVAQESDDDAPVIRFVNGLFVRAARENQHVDAPEHDEYESLVSAAQHEQYDSLEHQRRL